MSIGDTVDRVFVVQSSVQGRQMGVVRGQLVDGVDQLLWEEKLAHVLDRGIRVARVVGAHIGLHCHMNVSSSAVVVAGEYGEELRNSRIVGLGDTAKEGLVVCSAIVSGAPAGEEGNGVGVNSCVARVGTGGIASLETC